MNVIIWLPTACLPLHAPAGRYFQSSPDAPWYRIGLLSWSWYRLTLQDGERLIRLEARSYPDVEESAIYG